MPPNTVQPPFVSIVVIVYKMADQAELTLRSLSAQYQRDVAESEYEIIVVENESSWILGQERACMTGGNVRYFLRQETQRTPVHAANFGAAQAVGSHIVIILDGARMVTPGVVRLTLDAFRIAPNAAVAVPGYHLGEKPQQIAVNEGYDEAAEAGLLERIEWPSNGYRLFEIAVFAMSSLMGFFQPNAESPFLGCSREKWNAVGGLDTRYDDLGGGKANIALYKHVLETPDTPFYLLFGEGSFHQFHGGISTNTPSGERAMIGARIREQDEALRTDRSLPHAPAILFGQLHPSAYRFLRHSLDRVYPQ